MDRTTAVRRINDGLGFRPDGHSLEQKVILRLQEAQRDLEKGKTLPRFLILEDQELELPSGEHSIALPDDFIREDDDNRIHFQSPDTNLPVYLRPQRYNDAVRLTAHQQRPNMPDISMVAPTVYVIRAGTIDFVTRSDQDYTLAWNYYASDDELTADIENAWLREAPEWLIGEAGYRIALDLRDQTAMQLFDDMRTRARAATFGDIIADEDAGGPFIMGAWS